MPRYNPGGRGIGFWIFMIILVLLVLLYFYRDSFIELLRNFKFW